MGDAVWCWSDDWLSSTVSPGCWVVFFWWKGVATGAFLLCCVVRVGVWCRYVCLLLAGLGVVLYACSQTREHADPASAPPACFPCIKDVLRSTLIKEVLRAASFAVSMSFPCVVLMYMSIMFVSNSYLSILLMFLVCSNSWVRVCTGVIIPRRTSMV